MAASSLGVTLRSLRAEQLKRLSFLCGLPVGGRKEELVSRLTVAAGNAPLPSTPRAEPIVLSIDLGIRNLAYSLLTPVSSSTSVSRKAGTKSKKGSGTNPSPSFLGTSPPTIELHDWSRLTLRSRSEVYTGASTRGSDEDALNADTATEVFSPEVLSKIANVFLQERVLQSNPLPTHILIERQRWRSGGAPAIQEWTVRVNTLEAMLYASLQTLREVGVWNGTVVPIRPERVGQLFLDAENIGTGGAAKDEEPEEDEVDASTTKSRRKRTGGRKTSTETKKLKIELLKRWLGQGDLIVRPSDIRMGSMLDAYREASKAAKHSRSKRVTKEDVTGKPHIKLEGKLDDLTDSLMQGMAWLRWRENTALLRSESGIEQLLG
ncbi:mitochondrial resolvase Ydc2 [Xylaria longipes]|nr:mitochondrial resolvase Ydc2 [Xylaria longipes]RYC64929.1 hypothetical protein CHU98_g1284 [Xylaria longipes]